ncbi:MAG: pyroglutamyl-peptidase I [Bacteriovoracia bacterium]
MRVLISGFMPFGGRELNPTDRLIRALQHNEVPYPANLLVDHILLPVTFRESFLSLQEKITQMNPDVVICLGQAAGRAEINLESVAVNCIHADIPDNEGLKPENEMINHLGMPSYLSTLPLQGIEGALKDAGIPVKVSQCAGKYVCNYLFYRLMETNQDTLRLCGFIHVPILPEQVRNDEPSMELDEMKRALSVILQYINY